MTTFNGEDPALPEVLDEESEMELLRQEVSALMGHVMRFKAGNTQLIEALMRMAQGDEGAAENAQAVLAECGMLKGADGSLNWAALDARRDPRITWEQTVRSLVKQPGEVARLLAMNDEPSPATQKGGAE